MKAGRKPRGQDSLGLAAVNIGSEYTADEIEFIRAMEAYMRLNNRRFPLFTEVLAVAKSCGWRKVAEAVAVPRCVRVEG